jgi:hypothetical protein
VQKLGAVNVVGHNATDFCSGKKNIFRFFRFKKGSDVRLIAQIELGGGSKYKIIEILPLLIFCE